MILTIIDFPFFMLARFVFFISIFSLKIFFQFFLAAEKWALEKKAHAKRRDWCSTFSCLFMLWRCCADVSIINTKTDNLCDVINRSISSARIKTNRFIVCRENGSFFPRYQTLHSQWKFHINNSTSKRTGVIDFAFPKIKRHTDVINALCPFTMNASKLITIKEKKNHFEIGFVPLITWQCCSLTLIYRRSLPMRPWIYKYLTQPLNRFTVFFFVLCCV